MSYLTIGEECSDRFEEKKSIFIGNIKRVETENDAIAFINKIKEKNKEARHNVYAYVISENKGIQRYTDDGEPHGTGGVPVLEVIKKNNLTDTVIVVTRYFGGILLGTGGLVRAYSKGASIAVKKSGIIEKVKALPLSFKIEYDTLSKVQYLCTTKEWNIDNIDYSEKVTVKIICEVIKAPEIEKAVIDLCNAKCEIYKGKVQYYFKNQNKFEK